MAVNFVHITGASNCRSRLVLGISGGSRKPDHFVVEDQQLSTGWSSV